MVEQLELKAKAAGIESRLDYVLGRIEAGEMVYEIAEDVGGSVNMLRQWAYLQVNGKERWKAAMTERSHALVEQGVQIVRDLKGVDIDKVDVARAKLEVDQLNLIARAHNRPVYGNDQTAAIVNVNLGTLHLDAMRQVRPGVSSQPMIEAPREADYEVLPAGE
jgi:Ser-tRNA(Ala) deacylase AlaX